MSFFSTGFSSMLNERRLKKATKKRGSSEKAADSSGKAAQAKKEEEEEKDEGRWVRLTDAYGRTYWQHSVSGEWSYGVGGGLVSPVLAVNPSLVFAYPGAVFTPSPVFAPPPPPPAKKKNDDNKKDDDENKKDDKKAEGKGWWEAVYDDYGNRYWEHTVSKKVTYKDPYF